MTRWTVNLFYIISFVKIRYRVFVGKLLSEWWLFIVESQLLVFIRYNGLNKKNGRYTTRCFKVIPENFSWCVPSPSRRLSFSYGCYSIPSFDQMFLFIISLYNYASTNFPVYSNLPYITSTGRCQIFPTSKRFRYVHWSLLLSISVLLKTIHQIYVQYVRSLCTFLFLN